MILGSSMGLAMFTFGYYEAPLIRQLRPDFDPIAQTISHWTLIPWCIYSLFVIIEVYGNKYANKFVTWSLERRYHRNFISRWLRYLL